MRRGKRVDAPRHSRFRSQRKTSRTQCRGQCRRGISSAAVGPAESPSDAGSLQSRAIIDDKRNSPWLGKNFWDSEGAALHEHARAFSLQFPHSATQIAIFRCGYRYPSRPSHCSPLFPWHAISTATNSGMPSYRVWRDLRFSLRLGG